MAVGSNHVHEIHPHPVDARRRVPNRPYDREFARFQRPAPRCLAELVPEGQGSRRRGCQRSEARPGSRTPGQQSAHRDGGRTCNECRIRGYPAAIGGDDAQDLTDREDRKQVPQ